MRNKNKQAPDGIDIVKTRDDENRVVYYNAAIERVCRAVGYMTLTSSDGSGAVLVSPIEPKFYVKRPNLLHQRFLRAFGFLSSSLKSD